MIRTDRIEHIETLKVLARIKYLSAYILVAFRHNKENKAQECLDELLGLMKDPQAIKNLEWNQNDFLIPF